MIQWYNCIMNYVTTNIRIPEENYLKLKEEAFKKRKSFSAIIREKIAIKDSQEESPNVIIKKIREHASKNVKYLKGVDIVKALREMRYHGKW